MIDKWDEMIYWTAEWTFRIVATLLLIVVLVGVIYGLSISLGTLFTWILA